MVWLRRVCIVTLLLLTGVEGLVINQQKQVIKQQRRLMLTSAPDDLKVSFAGAPTKGLSTAPVVIVEYSEFTCTYCGRHAQTVLPVIDREYILPGKVEYVPRNFPLTQSDQSKLMAEAASCSHAQGKYWELHDLFFKRDWSEYVHPSAVRSYAQGVALDLEKFQQCLDTGATRASLLEEETEGRLGGVEVTPTFFLGRRTGSGTMHVDKVLKGAMPFEEFRIVIEDLLKRAQG